MRSLNSSDFEDAENLVPQPYKNYPTPDVMPYDLPLVLVPPEVIEMETLSTASEEVQIKKEDWPEFFIRLFPNDVGDLTLVGVPFFKHDICGRFPPTTTPCQVMLRGWPCWTPSKYSRSIERNVPVCYSNIPSGLYRELLNQSPEY